MSGTLLPLPDDPRLELMIAQWPEWETSTFFQYPRSAWLSAFGDYLRQHYPQASSDDITLTARHYFPGYLAAGHDVP